MLRTIQPGERKPPPDKHRISTWLQSIFGHRKTNVEITYDTSTFQHLQHVSFTNGNEAFEMQVTGTDTEEVNELRKALGQISSGSIKIDDRIPSIDTITGIPGNDQLFSAPPADGSPAEGCKQVDKKGADPDAEDISGDGDTKCSNQDESNNSDSESDNESCVGGNEKGNAAAAKSSVKKRRAPQAPPQNVKSAKEEDEGMDVQKQKSGAEEYANPDSFSKSPPVVNEDVPYSSGTGEYAGQSLLPESTVTMSDVNLRKKRHVRHRKHKHRGTAEQQLDINYDRDSWRHLQHVEVDPSSKHLAVFGNDEKAVNELISFIRENERQIIEDFVAAQKSNTAN
ncbi:hypothetical protein AAHC03_059 [Spirometra sp. Aus1]